MALVIVPSLAAACGTAETAQQSGGASTPAQRAARSSADRHSSSRSSKSYETDDSVSINREDLSDSVAELDDVKPFDSSFTADAQVAQNSKSPSKASSTQPTAGQKVGSRVTGAKPNSLP